jgi:hypothetical protein
VSPVPATPKLRNIGPKSAAQLRQVGIRTLDDLRATGSLDAFIKLKRAGFKPSLTLLYALEGALLDCHWQAIPAERRSELILAADAAGSTLPKAQPRWFSGGNDAAGHVSESGHADDADDTDAADSDAGGDGGAD